MFGIATEIAAGGIVSLAIIFIALGASATNGVRFQSSARGSNSVVALAATALRAFQPNGSVISAASYTGNGRVRELSGRSVPDGGSLVWVAKPGGAK